MNILLNSMHITFFDLYENEKPIVSETLRGHALMLFTECVSMELLQTVPETEIVSGFIYSAFGKKEIDMLPNLKMITTRSTGYDHIDLEYCKTKGIVVCNVPFYGENTVAEHTFALMLSLSRNVHKSYMRSQKDDFTTEGLMGFDLKDKTLGVVGAGKIGQHVIRMAKGFEMNVLVYDPMQNTSLSEQLDFTYTDFDTLLANADIISLHLPYMKPTHHLIGSHNIHHMKKGALLINTARGGIVDSGALLQALEEGRLAGAGLDVLEGENSLMEEETRLDTKWDLEKQKETATNHAIIHHENVVFTPHIGFYSKEALERIIQTTLENIYLFCKKQPQNNVS